MEILGGVFNTSKEQNSILFCLFLIWIAILPLKLVAKNDKKYRDKHIIKRGITVSNDNTPFSLNLYFPFFITTRLPPSSKTARQLPPLT